MVQLGGDGTSDPHTLASTSRLSSAPHRDGDARPDSGGRRSAQNLRLDPGLWPVQPDLQKHRGNPAPCGGGRGSTPPRWSRPLLPIAVLRTRGSHGASSSCHLQTHPGGSENHRLLAARWQVARCTVGWTCVSHGRTYGSFCERCPNRVSLTWPLAAPSLPWPAGPRRGVAPASSVSTGLGEGCSATKSRASQGAGGPWSSLPCALLLHRDKVGRWKLRGPVLTSFCFFFFGGLGCSLRCLESGVAVVVAFRFVCWQIRRSFL